MAELKIDFKPVNSYKVCNGVIATQCAMFVVFGGVIHVHRPVDDNKRTRQKGWQFSKDGVPVSYIADPYMSRQEAILSFAIRAQAVGEAPFTAALNKTQIENQRRLDEVQNQPRTA